MQKRSKIGGPEPYGCSCSCMVLFYNLPSMQGDLLLNWTKHLHLYFGHPQNREILRGRIFVRSLLCSCIFRTFWRISSKKEVPGGQTEKVKEQRSPSVNDDFCWMPRLSIPPFAVLGRGKLKAFLTRVLSKNIRPRRPLRDEEGQKSPPLLRQSCKLFWKGEGGGWWKGLWRMGQWRK